MVRTPLSPFIGPDFAADLGRAVMASGVPSLALDADLRPIWANAAFTAELGYSLRQLRRFGGTFLDHPQVRLADAETARHCAHAGKEFSQAVRLRRADGQWFTALVTARPRFGDDAPVSAWFVCFIDLTSFAADGAQTQALLARERLDLQVMLKISDLVTDVREIADLAPAAQLLSDTVVARATFWAPGPRLAPSGHSPSDPAGVVLSGGECPADVDLTATYPDGSVTAELVQSLRTRWQRPDDLRRNLVAVLAVAGLGRIAGLLVVAPLEGAGVAGLDDGTRAVLQAAARRVAVALENATLYRREHQLAQTMQQAMLPHQAEVPGLDVWTYYSPNVHTAQVGGDWYDILHIDDQHAGVVVGDVAGHDVGAAATMGQLRSVVRAYALDHVTPAEVLGHVDQLVHGLKVSRAAGLVYSVLAPTDTGWHLQYARAGHLPPLLVHAGQARFLADGLGPLLGFGRDCVRTQADADLVPGDVLIYFTDGLVERRDGSMRARLVQLRQLAASLDVVDAAGIGETLLSELGAGAQDDVAIVVVRVPSDDDDVVGLHSPRQRRWSLPADPTSARLARQAVERSCAAWDLDIVASAGLVVSELVANAVTHGWGEISLVLYDVGDGLRIEVRDANPTPPVTTDGHLGRLGGYGMKIVERLADWGWRQAPEGGKVVWARLNEPNSRRV